MTNILDSIAARAGAADSTWVDLVVQAIQTNASGIKQPEFREAVIAATQTLSAHKDDIASLGVYGLTLFLQKIATGDTEGAYITYIKTQATFQDLIDGENSDADAIIASKLESDAMRAKVMSIALDLAIDGARALIPFLLALLL